MPAKNENDVLPIMEMFYSIQGEGFYQGTPAYFVRLAGCDVGCHWCDVKESWQVDESQYTSIQKIVDAIQQSPAKVVIITGGEPLTYDLSSLTKQLKEAGFQINIETSGVYPLTGHLDWICFSPKKFKKPLDDFFDKADELKMVIFNKSDFKWATELADKMNDDCKLYLQPEWGKADTITSQIIDFVKENPRWNISLQTHKYLNIR